MPVIQGDLIYYLAYLEITFNVLCTPGFAHGGWFVLKSWFLLFPIKIISCFSLKLNIFIEQNFTDSHDSVDFGKLVNN